MKAATCGCQAVPQAVNPPQGYLATSNNDQLDNTLDDPLNDTYLRSPPTSASANSASSICSRIARMYGPRERR
jgi:hypothetical protein